MKMVMEIKMKVLRKMMTMIKMKTMSHRFRANSGNSPFQKASKWRLLKCSGGSSNGVAKSVFEI